MRNKINNLLEKAEHKEMIISHAAYGYWEKRYGVKQISLSGLSFARFMKFTCGFLSK